MPAAEAAARGLAFLRAAGLYRRAIELSASHPRWLLERSIGEALLSAGHAAHAATAFASAVYHAPASEKTALRRLAAEHFLKSGVVTEGLRMLREALADVKLGYPGDDGVGAGLPGGHRNSRRCAACASSRAPKLVPKSSSESTWRLRPARALRCSTW